jgi:hypothetical protein
MVFDPAKPIAYLKGFKVANLKVDLAALAKLNPVA